MRTILMMGCLLVLTGAAGAQEVPQAMRGAAEVAATLPPSVLKRMQAAPDSFVDRTGVMIAGYGGPQGMDAAAIARFIAITRAEARALRIGDLLTADLDSDGAVAATEVATVAPLLAARARGRLIRAFSQGDADHDGIMTEGEIQTVGQKAGLRRMSEPAAAALRGLMDFDLDGNGLISVDEVTEVTAAAARMAPPAAKVASDT